MQFTSPILLWSLALVPLYVWLRLRQRRPPVAVVSSLLLWKAIPPAPQDVLSRRERLWNLVLLVEGASLALICASLAGPWLRGEARRPVHLVLGIDDSASMNAGDRWTRVSAHAKELIGGLAGDDVVTLLTNDREMPRLSRAGAIGAVEKLVPRTIEDDLDGLVARARALAAGEDGAIARVLTDRTVSGVPEVESFGGPIDNAGIVDASCDGEEVFASIAATSPRTVEIEVSGGAHAEVRLLDARLVPVMIALNGTADELHVRIHEKDALSLDDEVRFVRQPRITIRLDSPGNRELVRALAVQPGVTLVQGSSGPADLVVLDRVWPDELPKSPVVVIAPPGECPLRGREVCATIDRWEASDPLLEGIDSKAVGFASAFELSPAPGLTEVRVLASEARKTVLAAGRLGGQPLLYIGFDVSLAGSTRWATHPHFPIFWNHVVTQLAHAGTEWVRTSGLCSRRETLCSSVPSPGGPLDTRRTAVVSSPRFLATCALVTAALGFAFAHFLLRSNGCPTSSSSTTR